MTKRFTSRERAFIIATTTIAAAAVFYIIVIEPFYKEWRSLGEEIERGSNALKRAQRVLETKDEIEKRYESYANFVAAPVTSDEGVMALMLSATERIARDASVAITTVKPLSVKEEERYKVFTIRISTESTLGALAKFIYDMQSSKQLMKVERITLRAKEHQPDTIRGTLHITKLTIGK